MNFLRRNACFILITDVLGRLCYAASSVHVLFSISFHFLKARMQKGWGSREGPEPGHFRTWLTFMNVQLLMYRSF